LHHKGDRPDATLQERTMSTAAIGIDVGKTKLVVVRRTVEGKQRQKNVANTRAGHAELQQWLARYATPGEPVGLEATGVYHEAIALLLYDTGYRVSVLNPYVTARYAQSQMTRAKTDPVDAGLLARYVQTHEPLAWAPAPAALRALQALVRRLDALHEMRTQELNRLPVSPTPAVQASIEQSLGHLDAQIAALKQQIRAHFDQHPDLRADRDLLISIPGIGETTAASLLGELLNITRFSSAKQVTAYSGLVPGLRQSGTSLAFAGHLTKDGPSRLRKCLYWAAVAAWRWNPPLRIFGDRLRAAGKPTMLILAAIMRKLVALAYTLLRSRQPFDSSRATA
jgi:transposase